MSDYGVRCYSDSGVFDRKDPDSTLDYQFNWQPMLEGDEIDTSTFLLPDGMSAVSTSNTASTATIFVSGGSCGTYRITNRITTIGGRSYDKTIRIQVQSL